MNVSLKNILIAVIISTIIGCGSWVFQGVSKIDIVIRDIQTIISNIKISEHNTKELIDEKFNTIKEKINSLEQRLDHVEMVNGKQWEKLSLKDHKH